MPLKDIDLTAPYQPTEWLLDGLVPMGALTIISSLPGVGKTTLLSALMWAMHPDAGDPTFLDVAVQHGSAIYVNTDSPTGDGRAIRTTLEQLRTADARSEDHIHIIETDVGSYGLTEADVTELEERVRARGAKLLVLDSFMASFPGLNGNKAQDVLGPLLRLHQLAASTNAAVIIIDHQPKPAPGEKAGARGPIGSVAKMAQARAVYSLQALPSEDSDGRHIINVTCTKQNFGPPPRPFAVEFIHAGGGLVVMRGEAREFTRETRTARAQHLVREALEDAGGDWVARKDLVALAQREANLTSSGAKLAVTSLLEQLGVGVETRQAEGPGNPLEYRLVQPGKPDPSAEALLTVAAD